MVYRRTVTRSTPLLPLSSGVGLRRTARLGPRRRGHPPGVAPPLCGGTTRAMGHLSLRASGAYSRMEEIVNFDTSTPRRLHGARSPSETAPSRRLRPDRERHGSLRQTLSAARTRQCCSTCSETGERSCPRNWPLRMWAFARWAGLFARFARALASGAPAACSTVRTGTGRAIDRSARNRRPRSAEVDQERRGCSRHP
jgi:hypothetical protein